MLLLNNHVIFKFNGNGSSSGVQDLFGFENTSYNSIYNASIARYELNSVISPSLYAEYVSIKIDTFSSGGSNREINGKGRTHSMILPITAKFGEIIEYRSMLPDVGDKIHDIGLKENINRFIVKIVDAYENVIDIRGAHVHFTLLFS